MEIKHFITESLRRGFAGETHIASKFENGFTVKYVSNRELDGVNEGSAYFDQWTKGRLGVGMELGKVVNPKDEESLGRVYGGGTLADEELKDLGISGGQIRDKLKDMLTEYGESARLFSDFHPDPEGPWKYDYEIITRDPKFGLTTSREMVSFNGVCVFIHPFIICELRSK